MPCTCRSRIVVAVGHSETNASAQTIILGDSDHSVAEHKVPSLTRMTEASR